MTDMYDTTELLAPEPMPTAVVDALRVLQAADDEVDIPMFRLDGRYIAFEGHRTTRVALVQLADAGLGVRYDIRKYRRASAAVPATAIWETVANRPVVAPDAATATTATDTIARAIWHLATGEAA